MTPPLKSWDISNARAAVERDGWVVAVLAGAEIASSNDERLKRLASLLLVLAERVTELERQ